MNVFLQHLNMDALFYGLVIFMGLFSIFIKARWGMWLSLAIEVTVFVLVFKLHGGTMAGGFAATVAALLAGIIFPLFLRKA